MGVVEKIEKRRQELGMTRTVLATRSKVSLPTVIRILTGRHSGSSFANVLAITKSLGLELTVVAHTRSEELRQKQSLDKARSLVRLVQGTSALEGQGLDEQEIEEMVERTSRELLLSKRKLWEN